MRVYLLTILVLLGGVVAVTAQESLKGPAAQLYRQAQEQGRWAADAAKLKPEIWPTADGRSFFVVWRASKAPARWIVSLPGSHGFATDDLAVWSPHLKGRDVGLVCVQWWLGAGESTQDYYTPEQIYREIDPLLAKLGVKPGAAMLHGFSRGSANSYAVAALDAGRGKHYFGLNVASSGAVAVDYPPTRALRNGDYGRQPLKGTRWITAAGARDPNPERDGIPAMRRTAEWLKQQGATVVDAIEDPREGHGALQRNPDNAKRVLDLFLREKR